MSICGWFGKKKFCFRFVNDTRLLFQVLIVESQEHNYHFIFSTVFSLSLLLFRLILQIPSSKTNWFHILNQHQIHSSSQVADCTTFISYGTLPIGVKRNILIGWWVSVGHSTNISDRLDSFKVQCILVRRFCRRS